MANYTNFDGLLVENGPQGSFQNNVRYQEIANHGAVRELVIDWRYNSLPTFDAATTPTASATFFSERIPYIPANSIVLSALTVVNTAFAGGTSYTMGFYQKDGTAISATGIWTGMLTASLNAKGKIARPDGVLVQDTSGVYALTTFSATQNGYIRAVATGTFTAGRARTTIRYIPQGPGL